MDNKPRTFEKGMSCKRLETCQVSPLARLHSSMCHSCGVWGQTAILLNLLSRRHTENGIDLFKEAVTMSEHVFFHPHRSEEQAVC